MASRASRPTLRPDVSSRLAYVPPHGRSERPGAKKLIRRILEDGRFVSPARGSHARNEMEKDRLTDTDVVNVLRGGTVRPPDFINREWRYRVETPKMCVVVAFDPEPELETDSNPDIELVVVTAWRNKK